MGVLDRLPDAVGQMQEIIREVDQANNEIKAPQTIGSSGVMMNAVQTDNPVDFTVLASDQRDLLLQFTPSSLSFGGGMAFRAYMSVDGAGFSEVKPAERLRVGADNIQRWRIGTGGGLHPFDQTYKFIIVCIGTGTLSFSLVD